MTFEPEVYQKFGLPPLSAEEIPTCGTWPLCDRKGNRYPVLRRILGLALTRREAFFEGLATMYPSFKPWATPSYSNMAYQLLAYALENISGKPFHEILAQRVLVPLNLTHTFYFVANDSVGIIPGNVNESYWRVYLGEGNPYV
jgi:CubicO group peptidase (beta-lactamase class C family)